MFGLVQVENVWFGGTDVMVGAILSDRSKRIRCCLLATTGCDGSLPVHAAPRATATPMYSPMRFAGRWFGSPGLGKRSPAFRSGSNARSLIATSGPNVCPPSELFRTNTSNRKFPAEFVLPVGFWKPFRVSYQATEMQLELTSTDAVGKS